MKAYDFFEEDFRTDELPGYASVIGCPSDNFERLVKIATGLRPESSFIETDLSGVDFTDSDIRGFNFRGADLRNAIGRNTKWDRTTNFEGADVSGSAFAFSVAQNRFFEENPRWARLLRSLAGGDSLGLELWLGRNLAQEENREAAARIAFEIYGSTASAYLKSTILYYSRFQFADQAEYRDFLVDQLARCNEPAVLAACLKIVGRVFVNDTFAMEMCKGLLNHTSELVRRAALTAFMGSISRDVVLPRFLFNFIATESSGEIRRDFLRRVAPRISTLHDEIARDDKRRGQYRDFAQPITDLTIEGLASYVTLYDLRSVALTEAEKKLVDDAERRGSTRIDRQIFHLRCRRVRQIFQDFRHLGLPFNFEQNNGSTPILVTTTGDYAASRS